MIPSALATQLRQGLTDFLRFSFWSSTPGMERLVEDLLADPDGLLKGPYLSLKLPFVAGTNPRHFPDVPLPFTPHAHQERAFERLGGRRKRSTLVATGTGSGKTECFLLPILDQCLRDSDAGGVKAILIYPMNALATDQAGRIARLIHGNDRLRGKVSAGLYIGEDRGKRRGGETAMSATSVVTDRAAMQDNPPDILLTNYKMLDYLLLRAEDQGVWQHNVRGTLRFVVVDEIHTFDGAQGTDLACLLRRLKRRLQVDDGSLCCVGTSATLGGPEAASQLLEYAAQVFGEPFDADGIIGEERLTAAQFLADSPIAHNDEPGPTDRDRLDPTQASDPDDWLRDQAALWLATDGQSPQFGVDVDAAGPLDRRWLVGLGQALTGHAAFQSLLRLLDGTLLDDTTVLQRMSRGRSAWRDDPEFARLALGSLLGLVSAARRWRAELAEIAQERQDAGGPRPIEPLVDVRLQLWQREMRRMVASVADGSDEVWPRLRHSDDLDRNLRRQHLPLVHCRDCGAIGWATRTERDKPNAMRTELDRFYRGFFGRDPRVSFLFPAAAFRGEGFGSGPGAERLNCETLNLIGAHETTDARTIDIVRYSPTRRDRDGGVELSRDCPLCGARESLSIVGFRAATLTAVYVDQFFASRFNDDKKLLTFSDSVQDAAHRAGFFSWRTWRTNLRVALMAVIANHSDLTLAALSPMLAQAWRQRLEPQTWVSTFLAPSMQWLHDWGTLQATGELPEDSDLDELVERRLAFEVATEFGLQSDIGRSLPRTGTAVVGVVPKLRETAVDRLLEPLRNEVPGLRDVQRDAVRRFVLGFVDRLCSQGGIWSASLPDVYLQTAGTDSHSFKRAPHLPVYGRNSRMPGFLVDRRVSSSFETWAGGGANWYARWVDRCFGADEALSADAASTWPVALPVLVSSGLLRTESCRRGEQIWGVREDALLVSSDTARLACSQCNHIRHVVAAHVEHWRGMPCRTSTCPGSYRDTTSGAPDYFGNLYGSGDLHRVFAAEHTGLLQRSEREQLERQFRASPTADNPDDRRKPWFPNLLSCTPTLEMGIDIGDLSSLILCSVPPAQANYLQRIGRAGRRDGNSLVLTVANARPHDLYFFASPDEMMQGEVSPPGVFLDAAAVLERQLTAFCFDRWVAALGDDAVLPRKLRTVFAQLDDTSGDASRFPRSWLSFVKDHQPILLRGFCEMFADAIQPDTATRLEAFLLGAGDGSEDKAGLRWRVLDALYAERGSRDSLQKQAKGLRKQIKELQNKEAKPQDWQDQVEALEREKDSLLRLVADINGRHTLEFFTDAGLLPNYAFPESAVRLRSVIWRRKKRLPSTGSKYEHFTYEYARSPSSALSELAPGADFYAGGRKVRVDQVDIGTSEVQEWRFCDQCAHAQLIATEEEAPACPACGSSNWVDEGQRFKLLRLRQVYARAPDRESRIRDDQEDRQPRYFLREMLINSRDEDRGGAWRLDNDELPFGFEFLERATFREVNFGEPTDQGLQTTIAGRQTIRQGFAVCIDCGKVRNRRGEVEHALSCPSLKPEAAERVEPCLFLYREFASEALRLLLPTVDMGTQQQLNSFIAGLQLGLKLKFKGSVDHLRTAVYSEPVPESPMRRQYLTLFDTVPGGTGYLKQLIKFGDDGEPPPLFEAMRLGYERIEACECWNDPDRDGCYRCVYGYRNSTEMDDTSATAASRLLRGLWDNRSTITPIESLGEVSITGLMDSVLEARFIEALRRIRLDGAAATVAKSVVDNKPGFRFSLGESAWAIIPQVNLGQSEGFEVGVSIDFLLRPVGPTRRADPDRLPIAVFLDGWAYHHGRIGHDLVQRMATVASGRFDVWTLTWRDLDERLTSQDVRPVPELAIKDAARLRLFLQRAGLAKLDGLADCSVFDLLEMELLGPGLPWNQLANQILAATMARCQPQDITDWQEFAQEHAPPVARSSLSALVPALSGIAAAEVSPFVRWQAAYDGQATCLLATLDDREEHFEDNAFKDAWHGYLRMFQLLRHAPNAWFVTHRGLDKGENYMAITALREAPSAAVGWDNLGEVEPPFDAIAEVLAAEGAPQPQVGMEIPAAGGGVWATAELLWDDRRVALTDRDAVQDAIGSADESWTVLLLEDIGEDPTPVLVALGIEGEDI